jgi:energy-coupling factor transporter ATP-binding protein EcfA2
MQVRDVPKAISTALERRPKLLGLTASFKINRQIFADNKQLNKIDSPDWQVVFGRRGAGKTTLLATYARYLTESNPTEHASIELNVPDFTALIQSTASNSIPDLEVAQIYFSDFMKFISRHLLNVFLTANQDSKFYRIFSSSDKKQLIQDLVIRIHESTAEQEPSMIGGKRKYKRKRSSEERNEGADSASLGLNVSLSTSLPPRATAKAGFDLKSANSQKSIDRMDEASGLTNYKFDYAKTRTLIEELLDALEIKRLYLFIDEWSELDRSAKTRIQPYFAELIKRVFWKNSKFVIKVGAIRNQTRFNLTARKSGIIGLELSADIFELNLDDVYSRHELNKIKFYEELIFRHLSFCNPDLMAFQREDEISSYGTPYGKPVDTFIDYIFKSKEVFSTLITGAGALPRDFIDMFDSIARSKDFSVVPPWTMLDVKQAVRDHFVKNKQPGIDLSGHTLEICYEIMGLVKSTGSRLIVVPKNASGETLLSIADLYHRRFLHDVSSNDIPAMLRSRFHFYYADLGLQLDVSREKIEEASYRDAHPLTGNETEHDVQKFSVSK